MRHSWLPTGIATKHIQLPLVSDSLLMRHAPADQASRLAMRSLSQWLGLPEISQLGSHHRSFPKGSHHRSFLQAIQLSLICTRGGAFCTREISGQGPPRKPQGPARTCNKSMKLVRKMGFLAHIPQLQHGTQLPKPDLLTFWFTLGSHGCKRQTCQPPFFPGA